HGAGLGAAVRLPKRGVLLINQTAAYAPSYLYDLFPVTQLIAPGASIPATPDYRINEAGSYSYGTRVGVTYGSQRGTRLTTTADYNRNDFQRQATPHSRSTFYGVEATVSRGMSHNTSLSGGYRYSTGDFTSGESTQTHSGTITFEYAKPL